MICNLNSSWFCREASYLFLSSPVRWNWTYEGKSPGRRLLDWLFDRKAKPFVGVTA